SMEPTLRVGDFVVVWTGGATWRAVRSLLSSGSDAPDASTPAYDRGDVIVFSTPAAARRRRDIPLLVKRIRGVPGDTVRVIAGFPFAGEHVIPRRGQRIDVSGSTIGQWRELIEAEGHRVFVRHGIVYIDSNSASEYVVKDNYYFVVGDNAANSYDSRYWGLVAEKAMVGEPLLVYWSTTTAAPTSDAGVPSGDSSVAAGTIRWERILLRIH
ncbi:MAG: signal peptidase I, partial [Candidatus Kapaibacterium sp.]